MKEYIDKIISCIQYHKQLSTDEKDLHLYNLWLSNFEYLKTELVAGQTIIDQIPSIEKLLSDPWLNDETAFNEIYSLWEKVKMSL